MKHFIILILAILTIGALEFVALQKGIDGKLLAVVVAIMAGLAGYKVPDIKDFIISLINRIKQ
jgi:hypothetical protein